MATNLFAVLGDPIAHSMSPAMHNELFSIYNLNAHYHPLLVRKEDLADAVKGLKAVGISGFNVTVPHKHTILPLLDRVDKLAKDIGAVNTVVNEDGELVGYNTDGPGFIRGLETQLSSINTRSVLIIGAGGAARAIYFSLANIGVSTIDIANRTKTRAENLIHECPYHVESQILDFVEAEEKLRNYDLLIQTTQIGMYPDTMSQPFSLKHLKKEAYVCDIIYNPLESKFLSEAKLHGAGTQNGIDMFVYQGALAFEKWTGIFPDIEKMKINVLSHLGGRQC